MKSRKTDWTGLAAEGRIEDLDSEDLEIEELLDIEDKIEAKIEDFESKAAEISADLLASKLSFNQRRALTEEKEELDGALESLLAQRANVRAQLQSRGYDEGVEKED